MSHAKYQIAAALLACGLALGVGVREFGPTSAAAQDAKSTATRPPAGPDIEPIDPDLVFDPEVQKQLRLSPNQVKQLTEARDKSRATVPGQAKKIAEIDRRIEELQKEINRLSEDREKAQRAVSKAETDGVKAAIPGVLSRDAVGQLRQLTLQRMRLADVLLNNKVRSRLELNDEQVKKIQEIADKGGDGTIWAYTSGLPLKEVRGTVTFTNALVQKVWFATDLSDASRAELIKVLSPQQREALERLSGMTLEPKK